MPGEQQTVVAGVRIGLNPRHWASKQRTFVGGMSIDDRAPNLFDVKADILAATEIAMGGPMTAPIKPGAAAWYHPGRSGTLALGQKLLGYFGEVHPKIHLSLEKDFDLDGPLLAFELFLDAIPESKSKGKARSVFTPSPYQAIERDFAFLVDLKVGADEVLRAVKGAERNLIETAAIFDVYDDKGVPEGKKSLAISVRIQPRDKTLTEPEIEALVQKIVSAVSKATGAVLRT